MGGEGWGARIAGDGDGEGRRERERGEEKFESV
jgi:hypothetical protein